MVGTKCPEKYLAYMYNLICGESVCGYGNRSTGEWVKRQGEGVHVTYMYILFHYFLTVNKSSQHFSFIPLITSNLLIVYLTR